jgi:uncharacterized protein YeaO (DUF488 family)
MPRPVCVEISASFVLKHILDNGTNAVTRVSIKRAYDDPDFEDGYRVLIDRMWPRGRSRESLKLDHQTPNLAPSVRLRKWFAHDPEHWAEFQQRYEQELQTELMRDQMAALLAAANGRHITLVYAAKDVAHNHAVILRDALLRLSAAHPKS